MRLLIIWCSRVPRHVHTGHFTSRKSRICLTVDRERLVLTEMPRNGLDRRLFAMSTCLGSAGQYPDLRRVSFRARPWFAASRACPRFGEKAKGGVAHIFHLDRPPPPCCVSGRSAAGVGASCSTYQRLPRGGGFSKGGVETGAQGFRSSGQPISRRFDRWSPFWDPRPFLCPPTPSRGPLPLASPCLPHALHLQGLCRPPRARVLAQEGVEHQS